VGWRCSSHLPPDLLGPEDDALPLAPGMPTPSSWASLGTAKGPSMRWIIAAFLRNIVIIEAVCIAIGCTMRNWDISELSRERQAQVPGLSSLHKPTMSVPSCFKRAHCMLEFDTLGIWIGSLCTILPDSRDISVFITILIC
jgi:hypothetical protein